MVGQASSLRYSDAHTQRQFELLQRKGGRPPDSPGWHKLVAVKSGAYVSERNPADHVDITAGKTHVCRDYWLARERPELFMPADGRDARTVREHSANLERTRQELERGRPTRPASPRKGVLAPKGVLPPQPAFRLPRRATPTRVLPKR